MTKLKRQQRKNNFVVKRIKKEKSCRIWQRKNIYKKTYALDDAPYSQSWTKEKHTSDLEVCKKL